MSDVQVFKNKEFGEIRTTTVNGEPMFCLTDVCRALELTNPAMVKTRLNEKGINTIYTLTKGGNQKLLYIDEANLYKTIFQSRKESAERFTDWVTSEVLPSIRKHGMYATDKVIDNILNNPEFAIGLLTKLREESTARKEAERRNAILTHVNKTYTMTEIAKELNMKSATQLNRLLAEKKIQYQVNGTWVMYSKYSDLGYEEIKQEVLDSGRVIYHRRITQMGREFILQLFADKVA